MKESRMPDSDKRSLSKQKPSQKSLNVVISLFDPQLDHIGSDSARTRARKTRSPILLLSASASPLATRYVILVSSEHEKAAGELAPELRKTIKSSIVRTVRGQEYQKALINDIRITIIPVKYEDIWNLGKCNELFEKALPPELDDMLKNKETKQPEVPKTLIVNLASSTAAARTALYLNCLKLLRDKWQSSTMVVVTNASTEKGELRLKHDSISIEKPLPIGVLAQGVGTRGQEFVEDLARLERVITATRFEKILITGPTGAGKSELAKLIMAYMKALHRDVTDENCIHQNVAAITPTLIESELFGHEKGAFTGATELHKGIFERANNGIVFLDEIGELPKHLQAKLLTVLDGVPFTRVGGTELIHSSFLLICGTNVDLRKACDKEDFRRDLFERLRIWTIKVPPIRDRPDDLETALQREMVSWKTKTGVQIDFAGADARIFFTNQAQKHPWPGNFREFHATFVHLAMAAKNGRITKNDIETEFRKMEGWKSDSVIEEQTGTDASNEPNQTEFDLAEVARLACALDACQKCKTASEAGSMVFAARERAAKRNGTIFNGAASLQRLFGQFGLKATFRHGTCSILKL